MTCKDIIKKYLEDNGYDGLARDECGCFVDDLFPCGCDSQECVPGKRKRVNHGDGWFEGIFPITDGHGEEG
jgi:hypothetical protein